MTLLKKNFISISKENVLRSDQEKDSHKKAADTYAKHILDEEEELGTSLCPSSPIIGISNLRNEKIEIFIKQSILFSFR